MGADHPPAGADVREQLQSARARPGRGPRSARSPSSRAGRGTRARSARRSSAVSSDERLRRSAPRARTPGRRRPSRARCAARRSPRRARATRSSSASGSVASSSSASSQPSRAPARNSCRMPSVASIRRPSNSYQPASGAMCGKPRADRKRSSSSSGLIARLDAAEHLQDQRLAEHDRRVGLLDADRAHVDACRRAPARRRAQRKREHAVARPDLGVRAHPVQQLARRRGVGERVVDRPAVGLADHALVPALVDRPQAERHLVDLVRPGREARLDEREHEQRRLVAQRRRPRGRRCCDDLARLGPNQRCATTQSCSASSSRKARSRHRVSHRSSSTSWNQ